MRVPGLEPHDAKQWLPGLILSNQATRQIGSVLGVALTVLLLGHEGIPVNTRPAAA